MSVENNVKYIKEELSNDEKMLEGLLRFEEWYKKYRKVILTLCVIAIVVLAGWLLYDYIHTKQQESNYLAYETLVKNPEDAQAKEKLSKSNSKLWDLWQFSEAIKNGDIQMLEQLKGSKDFMIAHLASYQLASLKQDSQSLQTNSSDLAQLQAAFLLLPKDKELAQKLLVKIPATSSAKEISNTLNHLSIKGLDNE